MKIKLPVNSKSLAVSIEGKTYKPGNDGVIELSNSLPAATLKHLFSLGYLIADDSAAQKAREAGVQLASDGQPKKQ